MGREFGLAPFKEQDKLEENLLRTNTGSYIKLSTATYWIGGEEEFMASLTQDKLDKGLIRFPNGSYYSIDSIEKIEESDCFVATAVYGDRNAPQVETLRKIRNDVLMQSAIGRALVDFYYSGAGKKTADFVREHLPSTIPAIRRGLDVLVEIYSAQRK